MASTSKTKLSSSTMSLRFMQRAAQEEILPQQAKLVDDSEWQVGKDVLDMWAGQKFLGKETEEADHESSYLPFMFGEPSNVSASNAVAGPSSHSPMVGRKLKFGRVPQPPPPPKDDSKDSGRGHNERQPNDELKGEDEDLPEGQTTSRRKQPIPQNTTSNRRPGALLSKGARLVQMAREQQAQAKPAPPPLEPPTSTTPAATGSYTLQLKHRVTGPRKLMRPDVHMPNKAESKDSEDDSGTPNVKEEEGQTTPYGKKKKRKREMKRVDLMDATRSAKKIKEIT